MGVGEHPLKIRLDLSRHCIDTEIKRLYNRKVAHYFKDDNPKQALENQIETLKNALEQFDFRYLRSRHPMLAGSNEKNIFLDVDADGNMQIITPEEVIRL